MILLFTYWLGESAFQRVCTGRVQAANVHVRVNDQGCCTRIIFTKFRHSASPQCLDVVDLKMSISGDAVDKWTDRTYLLDGFRRECNRIFISNTHAVFDSYADSPEPFRPPALLRNVYASAKEGRRNNNCQLPDACSGRVLYAYGSTVTHWPALREWLLEYPGQSCTSRPM